MNVTSFAADTVAAGSAATALTTATVLCLGHERDSSTWAPLNAVSHITYGDEAADHTEWSPKYTGTGAALNTAAMFSWAAMHAGVMRAIPRQDLPSAVGAGAAVAAIAYVVDYYVVPRRLTPGFEKRLTGSSLFWIYSSLAAGLAAGWAANNRSRAR